MRFSVFPQGIQIVPQTRLLILLLYYYAVATVVRHIVKNYRNFF